jgi:hypothetical protein
VRHLRSVREGALRKYKTLKLRGRLVWGLAALGKV